MIKKCFGVLFCVLVSTQLVQADNHLQDINVDESFRTAVKLVENKHFQSFAMKTHDKWDDKEIRLPDNLLDTARNKFYYLFKRNRIMISKNIQNTSLPNDQKSAMKPKDNNLRRNKCNLAANGMTTTVPPQKSNKRRIKNSPFPQLVPLDKSPPQKSTFPQLAPIDKSPSENLPFPQLVPLH